MCLAQGPQRSDTVEARTRGLSVSSQALYHWVTELPLFCILLHIHRAVEPHGLSRWRHGCSRIAPVSPRRRPGGDTVAPGVFPVYHGNWQPSRLFPVSPGCFKHFKTTGDMSRFNTVQHGSSRISKVVHGAATVVTRFITVHSGSSNRGEPAP